MPMHFQYLVDRHQSLSLQDFQCARAELDEGIVTLFLSFFPEVSIDPGFHVFA